jgi:hypothetical protein
MEKDKPVYHKGSVNAKEQAWAKTKMTCRLANHFVHKSTTPAVKTGFFKS